VWVGMEKIEVSNLNNSFNINIVQGYHFNGILSYNGQAMASQQITFLDMLTNGTIAVESDETGNYEVVLLPSRDYQIIVDFIDYQDELAYRFYTNETINTDTISLKYNIGLEREVHKTNVIGSVSSEGLTELIFSSGDELINITTDFDGEFELKLVPGDYTLYAHDESSHKVSFLSIAIGLEESEIVIDMSKGFRLSGTAYYDLNNHQITELLISNNEAEIMVYSDENGYYELWLPDGSYNITGELTKNVDGAIISYVVNYSVELDSDKKLNLPLNMIEDRSVSISYDTQQLKETRGNTTVTYSFKVINTGNIQDTYTISATGGNPDWQMDVSEAQITLPVGEEKSLTVTAGIPEEPKLSQNKITINAVSVNDIETKYSLVMNVNLKQEYGLSIEPKSESASYDDGIIETSFQLKNEGNGDDVFTLQIGNLEDLENAGWLVEFGDISDVEKIESWKLINISIPSLTTLDIPVRLTPLESAPSRQASVLITGFSQDSRNTISSEYIIVRYPEVQIYSENVTIAGDEVSTVVQGDELTNMSVMVISVTVALGLFYYARKKRWIR